jgi:hypothetical protein
MTVLDHLHSRYMNTDIHSVWINEADNLAVFPLWNLSGQIVGYQQYRPNASKEKSNDPREGRYFTRVKDRRIGVWGLESWNFSDTLFITEGIFDACRLTNLGVSAIASLSNDVAPNVAQWLWTVGKSRRVVAVCDNDRAGRRLAKHASVSHVVDQGDLGDATEDYVKELIEEYV